MQSATALPNQNLETDPGILRQAHEAITPADQIADGYAQTAENSEVGYMHRTMNKIHSVGAGAVNTVRGNKIASGVATGLAIAVGVAGPAQAETKTYTQGNTQFTETSDTKALVGKSSMSTEAFVKAKVYANVRSVSKAEIRKLERQGNCDRLSSKQVIKLGIKTKGYNGSGKGYALENRPSTMCDRNGDGKYDVRGDCGNAAIQGKAQPNKAKSNIWVNNFNKASVKLRSNVTVSARSGCRISVPGGEVYADSTGSASTKASVSVKMRNATQAHGKVLRSVKTRQVASIAASLRTKATAEANAACISKGGNVPPPPPPPRNNPPSVDLVGSQHIKVNGEQQICAYGNDPDGQNDIVSRTFSEQGNGNFISPVYPGDETGEFCVNYKAGTYADTAKVSATVRDSANNSASDEETFPIDDSSQGGF